MKTATAIIREIQRSSNLTGVVPVWSNGNHINIGSIEEHHGNQVWVYRAQMNLVEGIWIISGRPEVVEVLRAAILVTEQ